MVIIDLPHLENLHNVAALSGHYLAVARHRRTADDRVIVEVAYLASYEDEAPAMMLRAASYLIRSCYETSKIYASPFPESVLASEYLCTIVQRSDPDPGGEEAAIRIASAEAAKRKPTKALIDMAIWERQQASTPRSLGGTYRR